MLLKSLDKSELQAAFLAEESQRRRRPEGPGGDAALFTASTTCHCHPGVTCYFCEQPGHCTHKCHAFKQAKSNAKANAGRSGEARRPNRTLTRPLRCQQHLLHLLHHPPQLLAHPQRPRTLSTRPRLPRASGNSLEMQVFVPLTPPILFALYNSMQMLTGMQTQVPLLI
jgi:hypothetical protein